MKTEKEMPEKQQNVADKIGLIEMCFNYVEPFQKINTKTLKDLIFTIKEQKKIIQQLEKNL